MAILIVKYEPGVNYKIINMIFQEDRVSVPAGKLKPECRSTGIMAVLFAVAKNAAAYLSRANIIVPGNKCAPR